MAQIALENLTKVYPDGTRALTGLDLTIDDGEFVVLVGPSGCGKTTALRMVAGLETVSEGTVRIGGEVVNEMPPKDRDIAMVFQNYALYPHKTAFGNMAFALKMRGVPKAEVERRVKEVATILGLEDVLAKKPRTLSGGQRQRVAMGRAIVRSPSAFLMDEPLSNLDAKLRVEMRAEIARIQRDLTVTTLYVTHDQTEAVTMGDRVVVLRQGLLQQVDAPHVLYERPANLFVAEFIGSPAMNLIRSTIVRSNGTLSVRFGPHRVRLADEVLAGRPALGGYEGRQVTLGIRPEDMDDASLVREAPEDRRISVVPDLREDMGAEVFLHFSVPGEPVRSDEVAEAREEEGIEEVVERGRGGVPFVARVDRETRAREGQPTDLWVDARRLHFFDPATGAGIYGD